jgi:mono/diheme cytochrome c family protein
MKNSFSVLRFVRLDFYLRLWRLNRFLYVGALGLIFLCAFPNAIFGQDNNTGKLSLRTGKEIFLAGCVGCHGPDGKGMAETTAGFESRARSRTSPRVTRLPLSMTLITRRPSGMAAVDAGFLESCLRSAEY